MNRCLLLAICFALHFCSSASAELIRYRYSGTWDSIGDNQLGLDGRAFVATALVDSNAVLDSAFSNVDVRGGFFRALSFNAQIAGLTTEPTVGYQGIRIQDAINPGSAETIDLYNSSRFRFPSGEAYGLSFPAVLLSHDIFDAALKPAIIDQSDVLGSGTISMSIGGTNIRNDAYRAENIQFSTEIVPEASSCALALIAACNVLAGGRCAKCPTRKGACRPAGIIQI